MKLTDDELERYARHIVLPAIGGAGQARLKAARVAVIGAGGIGSGAIPALAAAGIGALTIIDNDRVERSNLQRQTIFRDADVGQPKAELAARFVAGLNPHVAVRALAEWIGRANAAELLAGHDLVLDGCDNFATRLAVGDTCVALGLPLVSAAAAQFQGQVALLRGRPCYRCFVGDAFDADDCDNCAELGVVGALTATVGNLAALMTIRALVGIGEELAGRLLLFDGVGLGLRSISLPADPACQTCGGG